MSKSVKIGRKWWWLWLAECGSGGGRQLENHVGEEGNLMGGRQLENHVGEEGNLMVTWPIVYLTYAFFVDACFADVGLHLLMLALMMLTCID
ncbi:hypothetical protein Tco_1424816 [Tanacetum coccineum]